MTTPTLARPTITPCAIAAGILWACTAAASLAAASGLGAALSADDATRFVETWRVVGFGTFAIIFAAMALNPVRMPLGVWLAVTLNKLILTIVAIAWSTVSAGAASALWWDGALTVALVVAFTLSRIHR